MCKKSLKLGTMGIKTVESHVRSVENRVSNSSDRKAAGIYAINAEKMGFPLIEFDPVPGYA